MIWRYASFLKPKRLLQLFTPAGLMVGRTLDVGEFFGDERH